jgi:hypothetical protein
VLIVLSFLLPLTLLIHLIFKSVYIVNDSLPNKVDGLDEFNFFELRILFLIVVILNIYVVWFFKIYFDKRLEKFKDYFGEEEKLSIHKNLK